MTIHLTRLSWKNFLSTGNAGTSIRLDRNKTTLVQGVSGAGKSTIIDALCFGLYGKPFRDINKPNLVNSVNSKQMEVEVEFETNGKQYRVVRGMKPGKFEIFCDDKLLNQDAALRDYQSVLERQILSMSFKTFTQIVIIGSTAFTPFMQLPAASRREVVEDILGIDIFSNMNQILKQQIQETKDQQVQLESDDKSLRTKAEGLKRLINTLTEKNGERLAELKTELDAVVKSMESLETQIVTKRKEIEELSSNVGEITELVSQKNQISITLNTQQAELERLRSTVKFFKENDNCPTCSQQISDEHKNKKMIELHQEHQMLLDETGKASATRNSITDKLQQLQLVVEQLTEHKHILTAGLTKLDSLTETRINLARQINKLETETGDIDAPRAELKDVAKQVLLLVEQKKQLAVERKIQDNAAILLKDSGIKTAIVREYLPLINKVIGKYLTDLQMDVQFTLDEQFNEIVKSRYRDEFEYGNFSTGEKLRIDLALLMTWRHIARVKNSASCNLLIIDEILSGTLDQTNQDIVIEMINTLTDGNTFIIAHGDYLTDKFRSTMRFEKQGNFSVLV